MTEVMSSPARAATARRDGEIVFVDCDGTLISGDLFYESALQYVKSGLFNVFILLYVIFRKGRAAAKLHVAAAVPLDAAALPFRPEVIDYLSARRKAGAEIVLATAAAMSQALAIAEHLKLFDAVLATEGADGNLKSSAKLSAIMAYAQARPFEYIGNGPEDVAIWKSSARIGIVGAPPRMASSVGQTGRVVFEVPRQKSTARELLRAVRPHQWMKNLLLFVPLITSHRVFDAAAITNCAIGFVAFSACASSVYLMNDMLDIPADRAHPRKRFRPFAAGTVSVPVGLAAKAVLLAFAFTLAFTVSLPFFLLICLYYVATTAYSLRLKEKVLVDVMLLSGLYTLRIIGGAIAAGVPLSFWLLAFSIFIFLSLALVKRYTEMLTVLSKASRSAAGRGYLTSDMAVLLALGCASGYTAILVFALYINSADVLKLYRHPELLWLSVPGFAYWISRIWLKAHRGELHDDPVIFAAKDWQSLVLGGGVAFLGVLATLNY